MEFSFYLKNKSKLFRFANTHEHYAISPRAILGRNSIGPNLIPDDPATILYLPTGTIQPTII